MRLRKLIPHLLLSLFWIYGGLGILGPEIDAPTWVGIAFIAVGIVTVAIGVARARSDRSDPTRYLEWPGVLLGAGILLLALSSLLGFVWLARH